MNASIPRLLITAPSSGSGKTVVTCGLLKALQNKGYKPASFKCGPDYIDPLFHQEALGIEGGNLDGFFQNQQEMQESFARRFQECGADIAVLEGVMGYFDGMGDSARASSFETASWLDCPAVLVVDARGAFLSVAAVVQGFLHFQPGEQSLIQSGNESSVQPGNQLPVQPEDQLPVQPEDQLPVQSGNGIRAVILNRVSPSVYPRLKTLIESRLRIPVAGYLPRLDWLHFESRHLGLLLPEEVEDVKGQLEKLASAAEETLDLSLLLRIAGECGTNAPQSFNQQPEKGEEKERERHSKVKIAVARDAAFSFYYRDNLRLLEELGGCLTEFSPISDQALPEGTCGLLLGGGYPEVFAGELSENLPMRQAIRRAAEEGMPILAECGGFLYLQESLSDGEGTVYPMAGVLPGKGFGPVGLRRFGYVNLSADQDGLYLKQGETLRAHEFHYWDSDCCGEIMEARKPDGRRSWACMQEKKRVLAGFPHLYYPSCPAFARRFVEKCREYQKEALQRKEDTAS